MGKFPINTASAKMAAIMLGAGPYCDWPLSVRTAPPPRNRCAGCGDKIPPGRPGRKCKPCRKKVPLIVHIDHEE